jgi:hypothetical protein
MTEAPYTDAPYDESGRVIRLFWRDDGLPIPPDVAPMSESQEPGGVATET